MKKKRSYFSNPQMSNPQMEAFDCVCMFVCASRLASASSARVRFGQPASTKLRTNIREGNLFYSDTFSKDVQVQVKFRLGVSIF